MIYERVGENIKWKRRRKGMTQKDLAEKCKCTASQISGIEKGVKRINLEYLERIAVALECDVYDLVDVHETRYTRGEQR